MSSHLSRRILRLIAMSSSKSGPSSNWAQLQKSLSKPSTSSQKSHSKAHNSSKLIAKEKHRSAGHSMVAAAALLKASSSAGPSSSSPSSPTAGLSNSKAKVTGGDKRSSVTPSSTATHSKAANVSRSKPPTYQPQGSTSSPSAARNLGVQLLPLPIPSVQATFTSNHPGLTNSGEKTLIMKGKNVPERVAGLAKQAQAGFEESAGAEHAGSETAMLESTGDSDGLMLTTLTTSTSASASQSGADFVEVAIARKKPAPTRKGMAVDPIRSEDRVMLEGLRRMVAGLAALTESQKAVGNYLAMDCEMVGTGPLGSQSVLARVSIVNFHGFVVLDTFVLPKERVTDWRTWVSGIRESDMKGARKFEDVQSEVAKLVEGKILVGHAFENDTKALLLSHPSPLVRDTQTFHALREVARNKRPGLKKLSELELGLKIQAGAHSSVTDARATMALYRIHKNEWEQSVRKQTDAFYATSKQGRPGKPNGKRKADEMDGDDADVAGESRKMRAGPAGGGRKGISSGLSVVVTRPGGKEIAKARGPKTATQAAPDAGNWWE